jgi:hypothetical protein
MFSNSFLIGTLFVLAAAWLGGCTTNKTTEPARSATEQLLLSTAADHALKSATRLEIFANQRVFLDATYFDGYDSKYALGAIRDALSRAGALLVDNAANCDLIVEARSGALSVDSSDELVGLPKTMVPVPLAGQLQTPEVAFYKSQTEKSVAKFALLAFVKTSRAHVYSSGPLAGTAYDISHSLFFVSWRRSDIPEKQKTERASEQYQTCFPQYDPACLPATNGPAKQFMPPFK